MNSIPWASARSQALQTTLAPLMATLLDPDVQAGRAAPGACDFYFGNPQEFPLQGYVEALQRWVSPQDKDWYAYKLSEPTAQQAVARSLNTWRGVGYHPDDVLMTTGAFAGLAIALHTLVDPQDEVIFLSPPWFFYEPMIQAAFGTPVRVLVDRVTFELDLQAIEAAISPRTRAVLVNSPNNPTGRIYSEASLRALAQILEAASQKHGRRIYLISDEAYSRIVFDRRTYFSPTQAYPHSLLVYTYGKTLLTPGQRIGYIALSPELPEREPLRQALMATQIVLGFAFPNALLQHAIGEIDALSVDIGHLQERRDQMVGALREQGYQLHSPEGTFYLLPRSPWKDDRAFTALLASQGVYCLPGSSVEMPGYFRIALTASDAMIQRSLPIFENALRSPQRPIS